MMRRNVCDQRRQLRACQTASLLVILMHGARRAGAGQSRAAPAQQPVASRRFKRGWSRRRSPRERMPSGHCLHPNGRVCHDHQRRRSRCSCLRRVQRAAIGFLLSADCCGCARSARRNRNLVFVLVVMDRRQRQHGVLRLGAAGRPWASVDQCIQCGMLPSGPSLGRMEALVRPVSSINFATRQILRQRRKHGGGLTCELSRCRQS